jgi:hypothetical protein
VFLLPVDLLERLQLWLWEVGKLQRRPRELHRLVSAQLERSLGSRSTGIR